MRFLLGMRTRTKLLTGFVSMAVIVAVMGFISSSGSKTLKNHIQSLYDDRFVPAVQLGNIATLISKIRIGVLNIIIEQDPAKRKTIVKTADNHKKQIDQIVERYGSRLLMSEEKKVFEEFKGAWKAFNESRIKTYNLALQGNLVEAMESALNDVPVKFKEVDDKLVALIKIQDDIGKDLYKKSESDYHYMWLVAVLATIFAAGTAIMLGILLSKVIANPLIEGTNLAKEIAGGDLTHSMDSSLADREDEIGRLSAHLNEMSNNLRKMVNRIKSSSDSIKEALQGIDTGRLARGSTTQAEAVENISVAISQADQSIAGVVDAAESLSTSALESSSSILEMIASVEEVARSTDHMASIVETISSSVEETVAAIKQTSENLDSVSAYAIGTSATVNEFSASLKSIEKNVNESAVLSEKVMKDAGGPGIKAIEMTIDGMKLIMESVNSAMPTLDTLSKRSSQIGNVLTVINNVTDQTNLLSLNAAIIAAQAGEHGKGFGVVADAIKELADQTAASTNEIALMIKAVQSEIKILASAMQRVSDNAMSGMSLADEAGGVLNVIAESSSASSGMSWEIQKAVREQAIGVTQINVTIEGMTEMISQIAQATKEQKSNSEHIIAAVEDLRNISGLVRQATVEQAKGSGQIKNTVELVTHKADSIAKETRDQKRVSDQIVKAVEQIKATTSQNLAIASEVNKAIASLTLQSEGLRKEVSRFKA